MKTVSAQELCEEYLKKLLKRVLKKLLLTNYSVSLRFHKIQWMMDISVDHEYLDAEIRYGQRAVDLFMEGKFDEIKLSLTHECTHILTTKILERKGLSKRKRLALEESVTEHIAKIFMKTI